MRFSGFLSRAVWVPMVCMIGNTWAGRPLAIDDADPVDPGTFEFEAGVAYGADSATKHWDFPFGLTYGLVRDLEVGFGFGGQIEERDEPAAGQSTRESGIGDLTMGVKWQFLPACPLGARHAIAPTVKFPTADDGKDLGSGETDCDLVWIASRSIGERAGMHLNLGYTWVGGPDDDILHYGLALDYQLSGPVQWVGEVFAEQELASSSETIAEFNTGVRWNPTGNLTLDIAAGSKLCGDAPDFTTTAGLTWAFGAEN